MSSRRHLHFAFPVGVVALMLGLVASISLLQTAPKVAAQASVCHAAMVLDRSGSVGATNETTLKNQILRLFEPAGLYDNKIQLAFWSFSYNTPNPNYDAPFNGFVSSRGHDSQFDTSLNSIVSNGSTDYEQGFGYNNGVKNPAISTIMDQADIIVFMTDGLPNTPGNGDNNPTARTAARNAVIKIQQTRPRSIVGGIVGNASPASLNFVINGNDNNSTNLFHISTTYNDLTVKLKQVIGTQCDLLGRDVNYTLAPSVSSNGNVVSGQDSARFSYSVRNGSATDTSNPTGWKVRRVLVNRGQPVTPLFFGSDPYRDGYNCAKMVALINGQGSCQDIASGSKVFAPGNTSLDNDVGPAAFVSVDDSWQVGTKVCYVLTIDRPTQNDSPTDRFSKATCLIVGKKPLVQVIGGDLRVGRHFNNDGSLSVDASVMGSVTTKPNGRTYGSWAEYGVYAPGSVVGFASLSGLEGGFDSSLSSTQELWSKLTFANTDNQYGSFAPGDEVGQGTIPDVKSALLAGRPVARNLVGVNAVDFNGSAIAGLYKKDVGSLTINSSTIGMGKTIIVYVPGGTVTISGNISYTDGPYRSINEIPQLVIIAKHIQIAPNVVNVDAWLIADDATDGTVSTCNDPSTLTSQVCNQQLRINGAIMAQHLDLRRTGGAGPGGAAGDPAEVINLRADAYLWSQSEGRSDVRAQTTFTTELPPYF